MKKDIDQSSIEDLTLLNNDTKSDLKLNQSQNIFSMNSNKI